ncbi:MAG: chlorite dismutase, partial [Sphingomonas sp.]|nr:chlorite dismutase [Sphingomonas sp.]
TAPELAEIRAKQEGLGRPASTRAALIPIRKSAEWWEMAQDQRRGVYERGSHLPIGLDYLPGVARKLYHSRDHGEAFDFLTWFEFAPDQEEAFDHMLVRLRACAEWEYVDREVDIRLTRVKP